MEHDLSKTYLNNEIKQKKTGGLDLIKKKALEILMLFVSLAVVGPIFYTVLSSFKTNPEVNRPLSLPSSLFLGNYLEVFNRVKVQMLYLNSIIVTVAALAFLVVLGSMAAYAIGRRSGKLFNLMYLFFLSGLMIPSQAGMIPLFGFIKNIGLMNHLSALILVQVGTQLPIAILIFSGFIKTIPKELDEAARIDGCGLIRTLGNIVFPILKPATVAVIITTSVFVWNDFLYPLLFIQSNAKKTLPTGIYSFMGEHTILYGPIFAVVVLSLLFPVVVFLGLQKYFYQGMTAGAVKG